MFVVRVRRRGREFLKRGRFIVCFSKIWAAWRGEESLDRFFVGVLVFSFIVSDFFVGWVEFGIDREIVLDIGLAAGLSRVFRLVSG